jgi:hypothetical protein
MRKGSFFYNRAGGRFYLAIRALDGGDFFSSALPA